MSGAIEHLRRPPLADQLGAEAVELTAVPPYDFHLTASLFARHATQVTDYYIDGNYRRVLIDGERPLLLEAESTGNLEAPTLEVRSLSPTVSSTVDGHAAGRIRWILGLDYDLSPLYSLMQGEPETKGLMQALFGLRPPRSPNMFEALVAGITEQQISLAAALTMRQRLAQKYGMVARYGGRDYLAFPRADTLAVAVEEDIRSLGLGTQKAHAIKKVAGLVASGQLNLDAMRLLPVEQVIDEIASVRGIGPWTVNYMLCRGAGRYEAVPMNDRALISGMKRWYGENRVKTVGDVRSILEGFGDHAGYLAFYFILSHALDKSPSRRPA